MQGNTATNSQAWWHDGYPHQNDGSCYKRYADEFKWAATNGLILQQVYSLCPTGGLRDTFPRPEPIFINYYTPGRGYEDHADRLIESLNRAGCIYDQEVIEDPGSWIKAQAFKPGFIQRKLQ